MPMLRRGDVNLRYETFGAGPPVLLLAPGGLRNSRIETWANAPWNPIDELAADHLVVAMDQRNTGVSWAPITAADDWPTYAADQLAVMDELGIERFAVQGMCIGGAFVLELLTTAPERITAAVAMQPIGLDGNRDAFREIFDEWRASIAADHPEAGDDDWQGSWTNLYGGDEALWSVTDEELATIDVPLLVLQGNDRYHPKSASRRIAELVTSATLIEQWKDPADQPSARAAVHDLLPTSAS